jgi:integrase/recombinase XerC
MSRGNGGHARTDVQAKTWLTPKQVKRLRDVCLDAFPAYLQDRNEAIIAVLYDAGLRRSELVGLNTDHVDTDAGTIYVPGSIQKGDVPDATIQLGKWGADSTRILKRYLRDRWKDTDTLFPSRSSDRITGRSIARMVEKAAQHADVEPHVVGGGRGDPADVSPHTLRHSVAYRIIQTEGGRLEDVQVRLRHSSRETTDRIYSHLRPR